MSTTPTGTTTAPQAPTAPPTSTTVVPTRTGSTAPVLVHNTPTPRLIRGLRNALVIVLLLFAGLTLFATAAPEMALGSSAADISLGQQLRGARATLAEADRKASVAFLAPATASANGEWTDYQSTIDQVSGMLLKAAADHPDDADELATVQTQISDYRRSVDAAWTLAGTGSAAGPSQFVSAGTKLDAPLQTLATLAQESDSRVGTGPSWHIGPWAVAAGWIAVASLVLSSFLVARRTHRVLNIGLSAGLLLVLGAAALAAQANAVVQDSMNAVTTTSLASARINVDTQTTAEQTKAAEDRTLLQPALGTASWTTLNTSMTAMLASLPDVGEKSYQPSLWTAYTTARASVTPTAENAKTQGRTTTLPPLVAFSTSAKGLAGTDASVATTTLTTAQRTQLPLGIAASVAAVLALFSAVWGLSRRLAEYV